MTPPHPDFAVPGGRPFGLLFALASLLAITLAPAARAQESAGIAAIVNEEVISGFDLNSRLSMVIVFSTLPNNKEVRDRSRPQVIRTMVDERIKMQEAKRVDIKVPESDIARAIGRIERQNGMNPGSALFLLKNSGLDKSVLEDQVKVDLAWGRVISALYRPNYRIGDSEVDGVLAEMTRYAGKPEYRVAEIFLPIDDPAREAEVSGNAGRLVQQLRSGASFRAVAQNFSQSASAGIGGSLGWVRPDQLQPELGAVLPGMKTRDISAPIRTADGIYVLMLLGKRIAKGAPSLESTPMVIELQQLLVPVSGGASPADIARQSENARAMAANANSCADLDAIGKKINSPLSGNLGKIALSKLPAETQKRVKGLAIGKPSEPFRSGDGVVVLMVCSRTGGEAPALSAEDQRTMVQSRLMTQRLSVAARQHLRNLKRSAFIDIRVGK